LFGVLIVTLRPGRSTQPVAASGVLAFGAAATQIVCDILLTNVTRRRDPLAVAAGWALTAAAADGLEAVCPEAGLAAAAAAAAAFAAAAFGEDAIGDAPPASGCGDSDAGAPVIRTTVGVAAAEVAARPAASCVALMPPPGAAQPAAAATATSTAAVPAALVISARARRPGRRLRFPQNITGILPALVRSRSRRRTTAPEDNGKRG
jgi:hypothetical protein